MSPKSKCLVSTNKRSRGGSAYACMGRRGAVRRLTSVSTH